MFVKFAQLYYFGMDKKMNLGFKLDISILYLLYPSFSYYLILEFIDLIYNFLKN